MKFNFFLLISFVLLSGCKKDKGPDQTVKYLPADIKAYGYFKSGSWWVYEEMTSHDLDSVYLYSSVDTIITFDGSTGTKAGTYESIEMYAHSFFDEYNYNIWANTTWPTIGGKRALNRVKFKAGDYEGKTITFFDKLALNDYMTTGLVNGVVKLVDFKDSMPINNNTFYGVRKFYDTRNPNEQLSPTHFYYAKNVGLIRKEVIWQNKVWNLVRYHIIQ